MSAEKIKNIVEAHDVLLFMKGVPALPQCGFSSTVTRILDYIGVAYTSVDVLEDKEIRADVKAYSDWPTIPQLYVRGEFIGGCDIIREMFEAGELTDLLKEKGIALASKT